MKQCGCGTKLRIDNRRGLCAPCYSKSPQRREASRKWDEQDNARFRAWKQANPERKRAGDRAWKQANPDKVSADLAAHRALKRKLFVERVYRSVVWKRDGGICHL